MDARPAVDSHATLAHWMGPLDANGAGFVHGGTVMKLCDEAGGLAAVKHCRSRVVTASMDRMTFRVPIDVARSSHSKPASTPSGTPQWRSECASTRRIRAPASGGTATALI